MLAKSQIQSFATHDALFLALLHFEENFQSRRTIDRRQSIRLQSQGRSAFAEVVRWLKSLLKEEKAGSQK
jgi:hypothetical protein